MNFLYIYIIKIIKYAIIIVRVYIMYTLQVGG